MKTYKGTIILAAIFLFTSIMAAHAHMVWVTPEKQAVKPGETVKLTIGFGHHFGPEEVMKKDDRMEKVFAVAPDGTVIDAQAMNASTYTFTPTVEGPYGVYAKMKPGCMSTTTQGRKMGNRKTLENVVSCFGFEMSAMTPVNCGKSQGLGFRDTDLPLEIIPQKDPASVKVGDDLPFLVLYQGKPLADANVAAIGANNKRDKDSHNDQEVKTGADGVATMKITTNGAWLFSARHKIPYSDKALCDDMMYSTALTLNF